MIKPRKTPIILSQTTTVQDDVAVVLGGAPAQEIITPFSYDDLDAETRIIARQAASEIKTLMRQTAQGVMDIGQRLIEVKERLPHGRFGGWLHQEFQWSERTAHNFMAVAHSFKSANFADLSIAPSALYALAGPSVPAAARQEAVQRATNGQPVTHKQARQIVQQHRPAPAPKPKPAPVAPVEEAPDSPYTVVVSWLAGRFSNDGQRLFAVRELLNQKTKSQYWPSIARLLPGVNESDALMVLDAVRADLEGSTPATPRAPLPAARVTFAPPAARTPSAEERLESLRRRLSDALLLPHTASDDELVEAVETVVAAWRLSEAA